MAQPCERVTQKLLGVERNRIAALNTLPIHVKKAVRKESVLARFTNIKLQFWSNLLSKHNLNNELSIKYVRKIFRPHDTHSYVCVSGGLEMLVFRQILRTYLIDAINVFWLRCLTAESWVGILIVYTSTFYIYLTKITITLLTCYLKLLSEISKKIEIFIMIYHKHPIMQSIYGESRKTFPVAFPEHQQRNSLAQKLLLTNAKCKPC